MDPMAIIGGLSAAGNIASSIFGSDEAAKAQKKALRFVKQQTKVARGDLAPYLNFGKQGNQPLLDALGLGDSTRAISAFEGSPLYKLLYGDALNDARDDVLSTASSHSMLNNGQTLRALQEARAKTARGFFGDYIGGLDSAVNRGQSAANASAGIATGAGAQMANIQSGIGDTRLAGILGAGNALQGGLGDLASILGQRRGTSLYGGGSYGTPNLAYLGPGGTLGGGV